MRRAYPLFVLIGVLGDDFRDKEDTFLNRKEKYRDLNKHKAACLRQKRRYYGKTSNLYPPRAWTTEEDNLVLELKITDSELSAKIQRSVGAIQHRRNRLRVNLGLV